MQRTESEVLRLLEQAGGKLFADDDIKRTDDGTMAIPKSMSLRDAERFIYSKRVEQETDTSFYREYKYRPWDGAIATYRALKRVFGSVALSGIGWNSPEMVTIPTGTNETEEVPWGNLTIPVLPEVTFTVGEYFDSTYGDLFRLSAYGARKHSNAIQGVFEIVREELETNSIYRGKAFDGQSKPEFLDIATFDRNKVIYNAQTESDLIANLWSLLRFTDEHRQLGLSLKRAVLLYGPYGTGKTMGSTVTALEATSNGWTFIQCRPGKDDIDACMATARLYQPSVIFFEDVDTISDPQSLTNDGITRLLELFDGISSKQTEIIAVMTTNHPERIHKGMLRPGRFSAVIEIANLDRIGIERMIRVLIDPANLSPDTDFDSVADAMNGYLPAFIREAVERAVRYNLSRNNGRVSTIGTNDLVMAANGLRPQLELMNSASDTRITDPLSETFKSIMAEATALPMAELKDNVVTSLSLSERRLPIRVKNELDQMAVVDYDGDTMYRLDKDN
jgi:transitional endoplasmic reticulum ATPase